MASDNPQPAGTDPRWQTFASGAQAHVARRFRKYGPDFRARVVEAALRHWPDQLAHAQRAASVNRIFHDPRFRQELGLSPIAWWLLSLAVKAILGALLDYWFLTEETPKPSTSTEHKP